MAEYSSQPGVRRTAGLGAVAEPPAGSARPRVGRTPGQFEEVEAEINDCLGRQLTSVSILLENRSDEVHIVRDDGSPATPQSTRAAMSACSANTERSALTRCLSDHGWDAIEHPW